METLFLETIPSLVMANPQAVSMLLGVTGVQWVGKIFLATTATKKSRWYKLIEMVCMIWGKAKENHKG